MLYHIRSTYICGRGRIFQSDVIIFWYSFYIFITLKRKSLVYFAYEPVIIFIVLFLTVCIYSLWKDYKSPLMFCQQTLQVLPY